MTKKSEVKKKPEVKGKKPLAAETLFAREEIMRQPSAFGVSYYVLVGAMVNMKEKEYSRSQVLQAIENFKNRKVKQV